MGLDVLFLVLVLVQFHNLCLCEREGYIAELFRYTFLPEYPLGACMIKVPLSNEKTHLSVSFAHKKAAFVSLVLLVFIHVKT